jgi:hypothetical protein
MPMPGDGSYTMIEVGEGTGGGMLSDPDVPPAWMAYVGVDDIVATTAKARSLGAAVVQDVVEVGDYGWMSVITDPTGATLALWKAKNPGTGGGD